MSLLLLDTTFLVDAERDEEAVRRVIADDDDVAISAISVAELTVGVQLARGRRLAAARRAFVEDLVASMPVLSYDLAVAQEHATLLAAVRSSGRPRGAHDLIIAATGRATGREIVTADPSGFVDLPGVTLRSYR